MPTKAKRHPNGKRKRHTFCTTEGCSAYLNENDRHLKCVTYLSPIDSFRSPKPTTPLHLVSPSPLHPTDRKKRCSSLPQFSQSGGEVPTQSHPNSVFDSEASHRSLEAGGSLSGPVCQSACHTRDGPNTHTYTGEGQWYDPTHPVDLPLHLRITVALSTPQLLQKKGGGQSQ